MTSSFSLLQNKTGAHFKQVFVKTLDFIRTQGLGHRQFASFLLILTVKINTSYCTEIR